MFLNDGMVALAPILNGGTRANFEHAKRFLANEGVPEHMIDLFSGLFLAKFLSTDPSNGNIETELEEYEKVSGEKTDQGSRQNHHFRDCSELNNNYLS